MKRFSILVYWDHRWAEIRREASEAAAIAAADEWLAVRHDTAAAVVNLDNGDTLLRRRGWVSISLEERLDVAIDALRAPGATA
jgi:hypothetical protein